MSIAKSIACTHGGLTLGHLFANAFLRHLDGVTVASRAFEETRLEHYGQLYLH